MAGKAEQKSPQSPQTKVSITLQSLRAKARKLLQTQPDPHLVAARIAQDLRPDDLRAIVAQLLAPWIAANSITDLRRANLRAQPSRWAGHQEPGGFKTVPIFVGEEWRQFGDLTADDLDQLAEEQESRASDILASAKGYRRLAQELRRRRVKTVSGLDEKTVKELMD